MCWEMHYLWFAEQQKAQETRLKEERRAGVIGKLLDDAQKQAEPSNVERTPVKEAVPAK